MKNIENIIPNDAGDLAYYAENLAKNIVAIHKQNLSYADTHKSCNEAYYKFEEKIKKECEEVAFNELDDDGELIVVPSDYHFECEYDEYSQGRIKDLAKEKAYEAFDFIESFARVSKKYYL